MAATKNDDVIHTPCDITNPFCGHQRKQFPMYYLLPKSYCHSFNVVEVLKGGRICPPQPPGSGMEKKPRLNRVKVHLNSFFL